MPRTGVPPTFSTYEEFDRLVELLAKAGSLGKGGVKDSSRIWWDIRPNARVNTLEIRICDVCATVEEATCIAAIIQALAAKMLALRAHNQSWRLYRSELINENKWRAARYGIDGTLIDLGIEEAVPFQQLGEELLALLDDTVDALGSRHEVEYLRTILQQGTSAHRQLATYRTLIAAGQSEASALRAVVEQLVAETIR
jgi:carboxylate-amine ligase